MMSDLIRDLLTPPHASLERVVTRLRRASRIGIGALTALTPFMIADARDAFAGPALESALTVAARHDDHPFMLERAPGRDFIAVTPALGIVHIGRTDSLDLRASRRYEVESGTASSPLTADLLDARAALARTEQARATMDGGFVRSPDPIENGATTWTTGLASRWHAACAIEIPFAEVSARTAGWRHDGVPLPAGRANTWGIAFHPLLSTIGAWTVRVHRSEAGESGKQWLASTAWTAGWRRDHTRAISTELGFGTVDVRREGRALPRALSMVAEANLAATPWGVPAQLAAGVRREATWTGHAALTSDLGALGDWSGRWERILGLEGESGGGPADIDRFIVAATRGINGVMTAALEGRWMETRPLLANVTPVSLRALTLKFGRPLYAWLDLDATWEFMRQTPSGPIRPDELHRQRFGFSLTARTP